MSQAIVFIVLKSHYHKRCGRHQRRALLRSMSTRATMEKVKSRMSPSPLSRGSLRPSITGHIQYTAVKWIILQHQHGEASGTTPAIIPNIVCFCFCVCLSEAKWHRTTSSGLLMCLCLVEGWVQGWQNIQICDAPRLYAPAADYIRWR